ncbi:MULTISPECIES: MarR family winged helix-turn-helix transcriptional regulator [unclassified Rhizobium]|uniref:MarR family winged helix-turn-helix transcriptional regulator n=1 Tax=unclassified Rhizobium TaxID=2613769 RepID=UPI0006F42C8D|nr:MULTISPECIES: MarR family winged helix-turn-helix transcriptional regulator [unclassified Rhizobium]KQV35625.1 MarR family transcriptional regulator [Rhizobium sp. Root1212]KRD25731.1 MarR family transcriptional regulator [Rhizobium sp. Root268]
MDHTTTQTSETDRDRISGALTRMRMLIGRRVIARLALDSVAPGLEISHVDVLDVVRRAGEGQEVTVGMVAEKLRIDPSRASRIVAEMVSREVLRREASQADARRIVLVMTEMGGRLVAEMHSVKQAIIAEIVADWSEDEIATFSHLFDRFTLAFERAYETRQGANGQVTE